MNKIVKIAFLGCGNIGCGVWNLLEDMAPEIEERTGLRFEVKKVLVRNMALARKAQVSRDILTTDFEEIVNDKEIGIVLEFLGGEEPAHNYVLRVLKAGKTVVTANKVAFALHWEEMQKTAIQSGAGLYYEAAVCGAIPIIHVLEDSLQANRVDSLCGIVNGTTNYILSRMSREGEDYSAVLQDAQRLGLAEPDPSADVDGLDAGYKLSILSSLAFHGRISFEGLPIEGISHVQAEDIRIGQELGYTLKLLAIARRNGKSVEAHVSPTFIPNDHPLANISGPFNAVFLHGHACGDMMFMGRGAGEFPTAGAIISDLMRAATAEKHSYANFLKEENASVPFEKQDNYESAFYVRMLAADRPGVLVEVVKPFAAHGVSIKVLEQSTHTTREQARLILVSHRARVQDFRKALAEIRPEIAQVQSVLHLEESL